MASGAKRRKVEAQRWNPTMEETTKFDPATIGLPADFVLTDWSKMKG